MDSIRLSSSDALLIVDVQNDFLPGGRLAIPDGGHVVPVLNEYIDFFVNAKQPVFATRDWHPVNHCSFVEQGGDWPVHCVADTDGAMFADDLMLPENTFVISKASTIEQDAYSGFQGTHLKQRLLEKNISQLFIGGLATDYCVLNTVIDALQEQFKVYLLRDAIKAVNLQATDGQAAIQKMEQAGAIQISKEMISND